MERAEDAWAAPAPLPHGIMSGQIGAVGSQANLVVVPLPSAAMLLDASRAAIVAPHASRELAVSASHQYVGHLIRGEQKCALCHEGLEVEGQEAIFCRCVVPELARTAHGARLLRFARPDQSQPDATVAQ